MNYKSGYDSTSATAPKVDHWSTIDVSGYYDMDDGWKFNGGVKNLLDNRFPFTDTRTGFDTRQVDTRGRIIYFGVTKEFDI